MVTGEEGSGKSALLANWASKRMEHKHKDEFLFEHYVTASDRSNQLGHALFRLESALKDHFQLREMEVPEGEERLRWSLNRFLASAAKKHSPARIIIVIDGVNKMKSQSGQMGSLHWLPMDLPAGVRFMVSCTEMDDASSPLATGPVTQGMQTKTFEELMRRQCPVLRMEPLSVNTRQRIITLYLEQHATNLKLDEADQFKIVTVPQTAHPQFLRFLLQALRMEQSLDHTHMPVSDCIDVFAHCDTDYEIITKQFTMHLKLGDHEFLKQILSYVYVSRDGLTEDEIWGIIRLITRTMPSTKNRHNFRQIIIESTMIVDNRLCFSHEIFKQAVYNRFICSNANMIRLHLDMAKYFQQLPASPRKLVCLPHHLQVAGIWSKVKNCLTDISNFRLWWTEAFKHDFMKFWASLTMHVDQITEDVKPGTERPTFDIVDEYVKSLEEYRTKTHPPPTDENVADIVLDIGDFLIEFSTEGHEANADVPASIHPVIPPEDLKALGVPHVVVEDGRSILWYPSVLGLSCKIGHDGVKKDDAGDDGKQKGGASKAVEDIPMRTTYYFSRWMWIQYPLIALGNCTQRFREGIDNKVLEQTGRRPQTVSDQRPKEGDQMGGNGDEMEQLLKSIGFRRPKSTGGKDVSVGRYQNPNKMKLPEIKFVRKAARSFRRMTKKDEEDAGDSAGKIEQRMIALHDSISNFREEFDFLYQQKLRLQKRLYELTGALVDINKAADSMGQYDDEFIATGERARKSVKLFENSEQENRNLKALETMCVRHPPHMPALINEVENKLEQDIFLLAEIRKRLFEQHFEQEAHKVGFKEMKDLAAMGVEMHNKLLDYRYQAQQKMQKNAAADMSAMETGMKEKTKKKKSMKRVKNTAHVMSPALLENGAPSGDENADPQNPGGELSWQKTWNMISFRTGITEPEIFFQRVENRASLEAQMNALKKQADRKVEALKAEIVQVESDLEDVSYDASFAVVKGQDTGQKKGEIRKLQMSAKRSKERTTNAEELRDSAFKGILHLSETLGINSEADETLENVNLLDLVRQIEVVVDVLLEEQARIQAESEKGATSTTGTQIDAAKTALPSSGIEAHDVPYQLRSAIAQVSGFKPRVPQRLPSRFNEHLVAPAINAKGYKDDMGEHQVDRDSVKANSLRIIRAENIKKARQAKEAADKLAAAMKD